MNYKKTLIFLLLCLLCSFIIYNFAFAGNVDQSQITEFVPNNTAKASEVNSNFNTLRQAINDNDTRVNEVNSEINDHKSYSDVHHSRYTDEEAVNAVKTAGIGEVTNNTITTTFTSSFSENNIDIMDGEPGVATSTITIPDTGTIKSINIHVEIIDTSDISNLDIKLTDPENNVYLLYEHNDSPSGNSLTGSWPDPDAILDGDITIWTDQNPKGDWELQVIDNKDDNLQNDGKIKEWGITIQGLSNDAVMINSDLEVNGSVRIIRGETVITPVKMLVKRDKKTISFTAADGIEYKLIISDFTKPVGNTHIYYYPNCLDDSCASGNDNYESVLFLNIEDSPSICCTLLSNDDDHTASSKGLYWATDNGPNSSDAWGNIFTSTFKISRDGVSAAIPIGNSTGYAIVCF